MVKSNAESVNAVFNEKVKIMNFKPSDLPQRIGSKSVRATQQILHAPTKPMSPSKPVISVKPRAAHPVRSKPVTSCSHVDEGAVWCSPCANAYLAYARKIYSKVISGTHSDAVLAASKTVLTKALREFSLTPDGIASLERTYAQLVGDNDLEGATRTAKQIADNRREVSARNTKSRELKKRKLANQTTAQSLQSMYDVPPVMANGKRDTSDYILIVTKHSRERMDFREVTRADMVSALYDYVSILPQGSGRWSIVGTNGVTIVGHFNASENTKKFVVFTTFWNDVPDAVKVEELSLVENAGL
jgi:hypothetical protein